MKIQEVIQWKKVIIPNHKTTCSQGLHFLIRKGIPSRLRRKVFHNLVTVSSNEN